MARFRSALLAGFIASSVWMFVALLFGWFSTGNGVIDSGGRQGIAWIGLAFLVGVLLVTWLIANSIHHSAVRRKDRKALASLEKERDEHTKAEEAVENRLHEDGR